MASWLLRLYFLATTCVLPVFCAATVASDGPSLDVLTGGSDLPCDCALAEIVCLRCVVVRLL